MGNIRKRTTLIGIFSNSLLFILKIIIGIISGSIALISDAFNSLTDIIASIIVHISVKISSKSADKDHPFGHHRAEPIAGLIVAIFTGIVGFEIISKSFSSLLEGGIIIKGIAPMVVLGFTMVLKSWLYIYFRKVGRKTKSVAIIASSIDHRNDVLVSFAALIGVSGSYIGYKFFDPLAAIIIGIWVIKSGFSIAKDNLKFLMGECAPKELTDKIINKSLSIKNVKGVHGVKAHYVGTMLHVQVHISLSKNTALEKAHAIGKKVEKIVEKIPEVGKAFVHIDPFNAKIYKLDKNSILKQ